MPPETFLQIKNWFHQYVAKYYTDDPVYNRAIRLKEDHTRRVCQNIVMLSKSLGLSMQDRMTAQIIALLHDVGRFKQYAVYGTFSDGASENHALLGLREVGVNKVLFMCGQEQRHLISRAIAFHNVARLPDNEDDRTLLFMKIIRDADKLDIWKVVIDYYHERDKKPNPAIELGLPDDPVCSPEILQALHKGKIVQIDKMRTLNDFKLLQISWVYDLNFVRSFQEVQRRNFIEQIKDTLPQTQAVLNEVIRAKNYVASFL